LPTSGVEPVASFVSWTLRHMHVHAWPDHHHGAARPAVAGWREPNVKSVVNRRFCSPIEAFRPALMLRQPIAPGGR